MKAFTIISLWVLSVSLLNGQTRLQGTVLEEGSQGLFGANVYVKNSYDGATTNEQGVFDFTTTTTGSQILVIQYLGFETIEHSIDISGDKTDLNFSLKQDDGALETVVIVAGTFDASDEKKATVLKPMDIVTTASAGGDIAGALSTLPGTQTVGETGQLFVRGGEAYEARTFIDGMQVETPYLNRLQDIPTRLRFSPLLFSGTMFSTGGYSAEFGQALSSVLLLNSKGIPAEDKLDISLYSLGLGVSRAKKLKNAGYVFSVDYSNLGPYFNVVPQTSQWDKAPETIYATGSFTLENKKGGINKTLLSFNDDTSSILYPYNGFDQPNVLIDLKNNNLFLKNSHSQELSDKTKIRTGIAFNYDRSKIELENTKIDDQIVAGQLKTALRTRISKTFKLDYGGDLFYKSFRENITLDGNQGALEFNDFQLTAFTETNIRVSSKVALRLGLRSEYSSGLNTTKLLPRASFAVRINRPSQLSFAYGIFSQVPEYQYVKFTDQLDTELAAHYILNYQYKKDNRVFRVEGFYKDYSDLIRFDIQNDPSPANYSNTGTGFARGFDVFYRDGQSIKHGDFWVSYSFLDTEKLYQDFPVAATPRFFSKHNLSVVYKQWIPSIKSHVGFSYTYASGRPFVDPNKPDRLYLSDLTKSFNDLSLNYSYDLSRFTKIPVTLYASVTNVLGNDNIFGYRSAFNNTNNNFDLIPVRQQADRFYLLALFISLDNI
ncbi:MAG: TonB-dependent receptor [Gilvibacter sp.]